MRLFDNKNFIFLQYLMKSCKNLKGGLQEVADQLDLARVGPQHQAGSDSLLTGMAFFKMKEVCIEFGLKNICERASVLGTYVHYFPSQRILAYLPLLLPAHNLLLTQTCHHQYICHNIFFYLILLFFILLIVISINNA